MFVPQKIRLLLCILAVSSAAALIVAHLYVGWFTFAQADEFGNAAQGKRLGVWGGTLDLYREWTGRFSSSVLLMSLCCVSFFPINVNLYIFTNILLFLVALYAACAASTNKSQPDRWYIALCDVAFFITVLNSQIKSEVFYWTNGLTVYLPALTLSLWGFYFFMRRADRVPIWLGCALVFVSSFVIAGFNEQIALLLAMLGSGYVFIEFSLRRTVRWKLALVSCIAAMLSLAVSLAAPGNYKRRAYFTSGGEVGVDRLILNTLEYMYAPLLTLLFPILAYVLVRTVVFGAKSCRTFPMRHCLLWIACLALGIYASLLGVVYGVNGLVFPPRALITPALMCFVGLIIFVPAIYKRFSSGLNTKIMQAITLCVFALLAGLPMKKNVIELWDAVQRAPAQQASAREQIVLAQQAAAQQQTSIVLPEIVDPWKMPSFVPLQKSPDHWINRTFSDYFGVRSVSVE